jgi:hypothetical protein
MQCLRCKSENEDGAKFCATCGSPLYKAAAPAVCHVCSYANAPSANFCVACGAHLRRRFVTPTGPGAATTASVTSAAAAAAGGVGVGEAPATAPLPEAPRTAGAAASGPSADKPDQTPPTRAQSARFASANVRQEAFDEPAIAPPRISRFELKAGLAVLILFLGGGLYWWSSQNDSRLAELALTAAAPAQSAFRAVADSTLNSAKVPEPAQSNPYVPAAEPPAPDPVAPTPSAAPLIPTAQTAVTEAAPKTKASKHKTARRRHTESQRRLSSAAPEAVPEPQVTAQVREKRKPNVRELVASCKRMQLFEGERCLWRLCDGKWGKDGCPSYN